MGKETKNKTENVIKFEPKEKSNKQINKIKFDKKNKTVSVGFERETEYGKKETQFTGYHEARKEFCEAFQGLKDVLFNVVSCLKSEYKSLTTITGYSISYKGGEMMGLVITAQIELSSSNCPLNINTPFVKFQTYCESNQIEDELQITKSEAKLLGIIFELTERYIKGESAKEQGKLPLVTEG